MNRHRRRTATLTTLAVLALTVGLVALGAMAAVILIGTTILEVLAGGS